MKARPNEPKTPQTRPAVKQKRFRIVKLEERITPKKPTSGGGEGHSGLVSIE
jgi:hypothetical protein